MNDHNHAHHHENLSLTPLFIVFAITLIFMIIEVIGGLLTNSLALLADAGHMLHDVFALGLALVAMWIAQKPKNIEHTFGYRRIEVIAAFINGLSLIIISGFIGLEAFRRLNNPLVIESGLMFWVALLGLLMNLMGLFFLFGDSDENINIRGAFLHILGDTLGSVGAITAAILIGLTNQVWIDVIVSLFILVLVLISGIRLLKESFFILMERKPAEICIDEIKSDILSVTGVCDVHGIHLWAITSNHFTFTCHIGILDETNYNQILDDIKLILSNDYGINHSTVQIEYVNHNACVDCGSCS